MATATIALDEAIKEYLLFRGFTDTLKSFEEDKRNVKDKGYEASQVVGQLFSCIHQCDLTALQGFWNLLSKRLFSRLPSSLKDTVYRLETSLLRLFLVQAKFQGKNDVIHAFFNKNSQFLFKRKEWKEWLVFPFTSSLETHPVFGVYLTKEWIVTFRTSLRNFFDTIFTYLPKPALLNFESEHARIQYFTTENRMLHEQLDRAKHALTAAENRIQQLETRFMQTLTAVSADSASTSATRRPSKLGPKTPETQSPADPKGKEPTTTPVVPSKMDDSHFRRAYSLGSSDKPKKKANPTNSYDLPQSHNERPSPQQVSEEASPSGPPTKVIREGAKNVKVYPTEPGKKAPFFVMSQSVYKGHSCPVVHCKFSPNGAFIASVDTSQVVKIWNSQSPYGTVAATQTRSAVLSLEWVTSQENMILLGLADGKVKVYNVTSQKVTSEISCGQDFPRIISLACHPVPGYFACSAATDKVKVTSGLTSPNLPSSRSAEMHFKVCGALSVWDLHTKSKKMVAEVPAAVNSISFNHNGNLIVAGCSDGLLRLFDMKCNELLQGWQAHLGQVLQVQYSVDETSIFSVGEDKIFVEWNTLKSGEKLRSIVIEDPLYQDNSMPLSGVFALDFDGRHVLMRGKEDAYLYTLTQPKKMLPILKFSGHSANLTSVDWSGGRALNTCVTASMDHTLRITNLLTQ